MPLQNRVTPFSDLEAVSARGGLMGNRGILHDGDKQVGKSTWKHKRWITCVLAFKGRRREMMVPGQYTHLFFLDEAVSLAAGHRPCKECRVRDYARFCLAWKRAAGMADEDRIKAVDVDAALHGSRVAPNRTQVRFSRSLAELPDGAFFSLPGEPDDAWLLWQGAIHRWSHEGYVERRSPPASVDVDVITPLRSVEVLDAGYVPMVHPTACIPG